MARGLGLRSRLISGRGGGGGDLSLWMNLGQQLAQAVGPEDPDVAQARQLQQAKMEEIQTRTRAQQAAMQAETEDQAEYNKLAERMFPSGGRTVTETGPPQIETEPGDIPVGNQLTERNQPLTDNDLLLKQLVRSRNQKILQDIALRQQAPSGPPSIYDIGGGQRIMQQPGGNYTQLHTVQPKEPAYGAALAERIAEMFGKPVSQATPEELNTARRAIIDEKNADNLKQFEQQKSIATAMARIGKDEEPMPPTYSYYDKTSGDKITVPTKGEYKGNRQGIAVLTPKDADYYDLLSTATPNLDLMDKVLPKILKKSGGGPNLFTAFGIKMERLGGSTPELAAFDMARNFLITNMTRVETGGVRPPQTLIRIVTNQLPLDRNTLQAAQTEIGIMRQEVKNRMGAMIGNRPQALPAPASVSGGLKFKVTPVQ